MVVDADTVQTFKSRYEIQQRHGKLKLASFSSHHLQVQVQVQDPQQPLLFDCWLMQEKYKNYKIITLRMDHIRDCRHLRCCCKHDNKTNSSLSEETSIILYLLIRHYASKARRWRYKYYHRQMSLNLNSCDQHREPKKLPVSHLYFFAISLVYVDRL